MSLFYFTVVFFNYMSMFVCGHVRVSDDACRGQKKAWDSSGISVTSVCELLNESAGPEHRCSGRQGSAHNGRTTSLDPSVAFPGWDWTALWALAHKSGSSVRTTMGINQQAMSLARYHYFEQIYL